MLKLKQITKQFDAAGSLCSQVNLFGFIDDEVFLTKSGDLGIVLSIDGVDYECLDTNTIENLTARLTAAFRLFDENCRVYQYLFKRNRERIPFKTYDNPVVNAAIHNRIDYLNTKADSLYSVQIRFVILYEGFRHKASILTRLSNCGQRFVEFAKCSSKALFSIRRVLRMLWKHRNGRTPFAGNSITALTPMMTSSMCLLRESPHRFTFIRACSFLTVSQ
jgi:type IV secretory pathway VirB4 component